MFVRFASVSFITKFMYFQNDLEELIKKEHDEFDAAKKLEKDKAAKTKTLVKWSARNV